MHMGTDEEINFYFRLCTGELPRAKLNYLKQQKLEL